MFNKRIKSELQARQDAGLLRSPPLIEKYDGKFVFVDGAKLINFSSNDYLGLAASKTVQKKIADNYKKFRVSASSSRLVCGNYSEINEAEKSCAQFFGYEDALIFPSGYQANVALMSSLFDENDTVLYDKHIHASLVTGLRLSNACKYGYNHSDFNHLKKRLSSSQGENRTVITESLFSMDGDILDCGELNKIKNDYTISTIVDEAHSFGVLGHSGKGISYATADIAIGTFGKAFGLSGALVLLPAEVKKYLLNVASPQIYTTAISPAHAASIVDMLEIVEQSEDRRTVLKQLSLELISELEKRGYKVSGDAHIISVLVGNEQRAVDIVQRIQAKGLLIFASRYPTVNFGKAIIRISLNSLLTVKDLNKLIEQLENVL